MNKALAVLLWLMLGLCASAGATELQERCRVAAGFDVKGNWSGDKKQVTEESIAICREAIAENSEEPLLWAYLGRALYLNGHEQESWQWIEKAAQKSVLGQGLAGVAYDSGYGVKEDPIEAARWYRKAAEQGLASAQSNLGSAFEQGRGVTQDYDQALMWYRKAADQQLAYAQNHLGRMYDQGHGVVKDYEQALLWYRKAADQGLAAAQTNLGAMYEEGRGVPKDDRLALSWYSMSAARGNERGLVDLARMRARGGGIERDQQEALKRLIELLERDDAYIRAIAAAEIGKLETPEAVAPLIRALGDSDKRVRLFALAGLQKIAAPQALPQILNAMRDEDSAVRKAAAGMLREKIYGMPVEAINALISAVEDRDPEVRVVACDSLGDIDSPLVIPALIGALHDNDSKVRTSASFALMRVRDSAQIIPKVLESMLLDPNPRIRREAALLLANSGSALGAAALVSMLNDPDGTARRLALAIIDSCESQECTDAIFRAAKDGDPDLRTAAIEVLAKMPSPHTVTQLDELLQSPSLSTKVAAFHSLLENSTVEAEGIAVDAFRRADPELRFAMVETCKWVDSQASFAIIRTAIVDKEPRVKRAAMQILAAQAVKGQLFRARSQQLSEDELHAMVLRSPKIDGQQKAYDLLNSAQAVEFVLAAIDHPETESERNAWVDALSVIDNTASVDALSRLALSDEDSAARRMAVKALARQFTSEMARQSLILALRDQDEQVRYQAAGALAYRYWLTKEPQLVQVVQRTCVDVPPVDMGLLSNLGEFFVDPCTVAIEHFPNELPNSVLDRVSPWVLLMEGNYPNGFVRVASRVGHRRAPFAYRLELLRIAYAEKAGVTTEWLDGEVARLSNVDGDDAKSNLYLQALIARWYSEAGAPARGLEIASKAYVLAATWEHSLRVVLTWQCAEALMALSRPVEALDWLRAANADLPWITGVERRDSELLFESYTDTLMGRNLLMLKRPGEAVSVLQRAESQVKRDASLSMGFVREEEANRMLHLIYNFRSQAQWEGAKEDAKKGFGAWRKG